jgi:hypothetical protein
MENDDDDFQAFELPPRDAHPADIAARLMLDPVHRHLSDNEVQFGWLMRGQPKDKGGKRELGSVHAVKTMFQGGFKDLGLQLLAVILGGLPEFVVVLDAEWWRQASPVQREALVWHELCHVRQSLDKFGAPRFDRDGLPVFGIVEHDIAAFESEVVRYGAWTPDIAAFLNAARSA